MDAGDSQTQVKRFVRLTNLIPEIRDTRCCLGRQVVVIEDLKETAKQLRSIDNNLNRLTVLANMGRVDAANLDIMAQELAAVSAALRELQERGRWQK